MRKLISLFLLILPMQIFAQKVHNLTTSALIDAADNDSTFVISTSTGFTNVRVFRSDVGRDTVNTGWVLIDGINADLTLEFGFINISGTDNVTLNFEAFRGQGTPDSSGISRHAIQTFTGVNDTTLTYHLTDSTWVSKRLFSKYRISLYENGNQQNDYIININQYSPNNKSIRIDK